VSDEQLLAKAREAVPLATAERYVRNSISYWDLVVMAEYVRRGEIVQLARELRDERESPTPDYTMRKILWDRLDKLLDEEQM
jgi:hypothetical protein